MGQVGLLDGRVALITGGSRGLGRALCEVFVREGAKVAFTWKSSAKGAGETEALGAMGFQADVLDAARMKAVVDTVCAELGPLDLLVNNAGVGQVVPLALMEETDWDRMLDTHAKGAFLTTRAALRPMIREKRGHILNMSSLAGVKMMNAPVHYAAAKAAMKGMTEALAKEVGRYGILVNCLAPGLLEGGVSVNLPDRKLAQYIDHCALGRVGTMAEVAEMAAMLCCSRNTYMSGATIVLDGAV